jgi:hypothetical protein
MRILAVIAVMIGIGFQVWGQPSRLIVKPTAEQAYKLLLNAECFAFGGTGFIAVPSQGELAYRAIARCTNALALFKATLTNANPHGQLYGLCGIREFEPASFQTQAEALRIANPKVLTMSGCVGHYDFATNVIDRIRSGYYDADLRSARH